MGQQQLLLLVLATVIVGIATVVGIQAFSQNNLKSNADAMLNDAVRIASDAQGWSQKSQPFGGPGTFGDVGAATLPALGYATPFVNLNGSFEAAGTSGANLTITGTNAEFSNQVQVVVCGTADNEVVGGITQLDGVAQTPDLTCPAV